MARAEACCAGGGPVLWQHLRSLDGPSFQGVFGFRLRQRQRLLNCGAARQRRGAFPVQLPCPWPGTRECPEREDGLKIPGGQTLHGADIDSFGDHRIAMAFAVAALRAEGETTIHRADAAVISCPGFFAALEALSQR